LIGDRVLAGSSSGGTSEFGTALGPPLAVTTAS
jgi:hypothetical protein